MSREGASIRQIEMGFATRRASRIERKDEGISESRSSGLTSAVGGKCGPFQHAWRRGVGGCAEAASFTLESILDKGFSANLPKETAALRVILQQQHSSTIIKRKFEEDEDKCSDKQKRP